MRTPVIALAALVWACSAPAHASEIKIDHEHYTLTFGADDTLKSGAESSCHVTIVPKGNWTLKDTTPFKAKLSSKSDVSIAKAEFTAKDFSDQTTPEKTIRTGFTPQSAGDKSLDGKLTFFLCTEEICQRHKQKVALKFKVN